MCVINATATATEVLKNIVLPGVGHFTIVDGHKISGEDVGNNFFLDIGIGYINNQDTPPNNSKSELA